ncbi:DUF3072 domain-containing protein [Conexibacter sp. W3-3-2]|uniref:DUF3072 domain-containing protein n=1 Tax=Conexibacter sp. W3-3-2 TaxID=2675227 RepID=UPI0012B83DC1|nr:DUF3072 domain-containing protein [Conexibacter sp. W3-3-2]MTD47683.1 DUF3072 domain-containing protein [Conexibacter sp. W3-3-2]
MPDKPSTPRQRSYLATLARQAGRSIPQPSSLTSAQASKLIRELKAGPRRRDLPTGRDLTRPTALATAPTDDEAPSRDYPGRDDAPRGDGKRTVLASYELDGHDRQIVGQTTHGNKRRIWDQGLTGPDTTLIASNYRGRSLTELQALIDAYIERAPQHYAQTGQLPRLKD